MTTLARTETLEQRTAILRRLLLRNRVVGILRIGIPAIGLIVFAALALQLYVASLFKQYGVSGIAIDRNNLIVETPSYTGTNPDGTRYTMTSETARAALENTDLVRLTNPAFVMTRPDKSVLHASAAEGQLQMGTQLLTIPGVMNISSDAGMTGTIDKVTIHLDHRNMESAGPVNIDFGNGQTIKADSMTYVSRGAVYTFTNAIVTLPDVPRDTASSSSSAEPAP